MEFLNEWTYTICITLIVSIIFSLLLPKGNAGKFGKIVITVFIIISFVSPLQSKGFDFNLDEFYNSEQSEEQLQESSYAQIIKANVDEKLTEGNYENCRSSAEVSIADDEIVIDSVKIYILDKYDKDEVANYIFEQLGINAEVYYIGE